MTEYQCDELKKLMSEINENLKIIINKLEKDNGKEDKYTGFHPSADTGTSGDLRTANSTTGTEEVRQSSSGVHKGRIRKLPRSV